MDKPYDVTVTVSYTVTVRVEAADDEAAERSGAATVRRDCPEFIDVGATQGAFQTVDVAFVDEPEDVR